MGKRERPEDLQATGSEEKKQRTEKTYEAKGERKKETRAEKKEQVPKRKIAMLIAYSGIGYQGMQINPGANTIELHLSKALFEAGAIDPRNMERLQKVAWMRCARTDKGVHAAGQIVSAKLMMNKNILDKTNELLPENIRIFDYVRVTGGFDSKRQCEARTYEYTLRTEVLRPSKKHPNYAERENWKFDEEEEAKFRNLLMKYKGTQKYHNFTKGATPTTASCARYIMEIDLSSPFEVEGMEFVRVTLKGQSFILHQIRKMIGTAVFIFRDGAPSTVLNKCLSDIQVNLPMVPGLGLTLLKCHFDLYERTRGKDREPLTFETRQEEVEKFKQEHIYSQIFKMEKEEDVSMNWLSTLEEKEFEIDYESDLLKC